MSNTMNTNEEYVQLALENFLEEGDNKKIDRTKEEVFLPTYTSSQYSMFNEGPDKYNLTGEVYLKYFANLELILDKGIDGEKINKLEKRLEQAFIEQPKNFYNFKVNQPNYLNKKNYLKMINTKFEACYKAKPEYFDSDYENKPEFINMVNSMVSKLSDWSRNIKMVEFGKYYHICRLHVNGKVLGGSYTFNNFKFYTLEDDDKKDKYVRFKYTYHLDFEAPGPLFKKEFAEKRKSSKKPEDYTRETVIRPDWFVHTTATIYNNIIININLSDYTYSIDFHDDDKCDSLIELKDYNFLKLFKDVKDCNYLNSAFIKNIFE